MVFFCFVRYLFYCPELDIYKEIKIKCDKLWTWMLWVYVLYLRLLKDNTILGTALNIQRTNRQLEPIDNLS